MDPNILCTLLAQQIPPEQFQLWGLEVHWMDESYNTPENQTIVADVIANYDALAAVYIAERQKRTGHETKILAKIRDLAIKDLKKEGELPADYKDKG